MKKLYGLAFMLAIFQITVFADLTPITIYDGSHEYVTWGTAKQKAWWVNQNEDNEVEPKCVADQNWDLEGFYQDGNDLTMIGGYDFEQGFGGEMPGDIFIDTDKDGDYEFVVKLDFGVQGTEGDESYEIYALTDDSDLKGVKYPQNNDSYPWMCEISDEEKVACGDFDFDLLSGDELETELGVILNGDADDDGHFVVNGIDLSFLGDEDFFVHYTMQCGNDNLMGAMNTVSLPEPNTLSLLSMGSLCMIGFWASRRKKEE